MKLFNDTVYKCDLLSVAPDAKIYCDKSKRQNIADAKTIKVKEIMVQRGLLSNYMIEIITGRKIPIYLIQKLPGYSFETEELIYRYPPKSSCFVRCIEEYDGEEYLKDNLKKATFEEVEHYLESNDPLELAEVFATLFDTADDYYQEAFNKKIESDEKKIKKILKFRKNSY